MSLIRIAAAVIVDDEGRTLLVRKRGTLAFMQAGGKLDREEAPIETLRREIKEELGCGISGPIRTLGRFQAKAANEADTIVDAELFAIELSGDIRPAAEIEEAAWHDPDDLDTRPLAPLTRNHVLPIVREIRRQR